MAVGDSALYSSVNGNNNTALGISSMYVTLAGSNNTAVGLRSLYDNAGGNNNVALGQNALYSNVSGSDNTVIGTTADVTVNNLNNATALGYGTVVDSSNKVRIGNTSVISIGGQVAWTNFSDERVKNHIEENIPGLAFINQLKPVTYHYDLEKENQLLGIKNDKEWEGKHDIENIAFSGFLAQQVDAAAKSIGYDFSGVDKHGSIWGLRYSEFVPSLVKSVQELDQHGQQTDDRVTQQQKMIDELKRIVEEQQKQIDELLNKK
jgi:hypothetical protein